MKTYFKYGYVIFVAHLIICLSGCDTGYTSTANSSSPNISTNTEDIVISTVATIPATASVSAEYTAVYIDNYLNSNVNLQNTKITINGKDLPIFLVNQYIDASDCIQIEKKSTCKLKVFTKAQTQSYLLELTYQDEVGKIYNSSTIISSNKLLPVQNGFIYDASSLTMVANSKQTLTIPFRLANSYKNIQVLLDNTPVDFTCNNNNYSKNTLCSALINNNNLTGRVSQFKITGYDNNDQTSNTSVSILSFTSSQTANLITSGINVVIPATDGSSPQQVFLYNNGKTMATNITFNQRTPIIISSNTCGTTLAINSSCSFFVNVTGGIASGQSQVGITYNDSQNTQVLYFNVNYISQALSPSLTLTTSGVFTNQVVGNTVFMSINVTNSGTSTLTNLLFNNVNSQNNSMSSGASNTTCINGQSLAVGASCVMVLSYTPNSVSSGLVNFIPVANYVGQAGQTLTYTNSSLSIAYSSVNSTSFTAVGDFGIVMSSTAGTPGTWTANVNSPFATTTTSANGIVVNGNTYAVMMNTGTVRSSVNNGLFWQQAGTTNLNNSTCGIIFDGAGYYTCGTTSGTSISNCTTANRGCVIRSGSPIGTGWSGVYMTPNTRPINKFYYFTNGSTPAYVATIGSTTANSGLGTSNTGVANFTSTSAGLSAANSNMTAVAYNNTLGTVTAWDTVGFNSTRAFTSITSAWTGNAVNRPANTSVNDALFQNSLYHVVTTTGKVYTTATSTGTYTLRYNGTVRLNGLAYANGTYLAVGNTGTVVESVTGSTWAAQTAFTIAQATTPNLSSAYFESSGNQFWVTGVNAIAKSPTTNPPVWTTPGLRSITKNGNGYLAVDNQGNIYSSTNLTSWVQQTNPSGQILNYISCIATNVCFAVGNNSAVIKTTNGTTWSTVTNGVSGNIYSFVCPTSNLCYLVGGSGTNNSGFVLTMTNSSTINAVASSLATTALKSIVYYNNQYITVGNTGTIFTSTNGINWIASTSGTSNNLNSISCGNGCVAVGNSGTIVYSGNMTIWSTVTSGTTNHLNSIAYKGNLFIAVGNAGTIRYSTTGSSGWTTATFPGTSSTNTNLFAIISQ